MPVSAKHTQKTAIHASASFLWRMVIQALILTAFVIVVLTTLSFVISRMMLERSVLSQITTIATIAENSLENTLQSHRERASLLSDSVDIIAVLHGRGNASMLESLLSATRVNQAALESMGVFDAAGNPLAAAGDREDVPLEVRGMPSHRAVVTDAGWTHYDVVAPVWEDNRILGYLTARYRIQPALEPLLSAMPALGETAEVVFSRNGGGVQDIIHPSLDPADSYVLSPGPLPADSIVLRAMNGIEAVERAHDYRGRDVLVAYRFLPSIGWGMFIQVERDAALQDVRSLAIAHGATGTLLLVIAGTLAYILAGQITQPLRGLTDRVRTLRPGSWGIKRSVFTGDEVEVLDQVVVDLATRLRRVYDRQEDIIDERTRELREQYALDSAILESIEYGVITVDREGNVNGGNPAAASLLQLAIPDMTGRTVEDVLHLLDHRGNPVADPHPVRDCLRTGKPQRSPADDRLTLSLPDDSRLPVTYTVSPLVIQEKVFGAIFVFQDVTEERRLDYLKSEFISLASHQLRTPLSALRWYVELFSEDTKKLSAEHKEYLSEMHTSIERMVSLLTALLHAAHLEGDNLELDMKHVDIAQIMHEVNEDSQSLVRENGLECRLKTPGKSIMLQTDPTLLRIVLQNLVSNALKYSFDTPKKPIELALTENDTSVSISVTDQGLGIPASEQPRVFQKFFRARNVRKRDTDGNGLGLYITRSIVERLGGVIHFTSEENKGSVFTVTFPKTQKEVKGREG